MHAGFSERSFNLLIAAIAALVVIIVILISIFVIVQVYKCRKICCNQGDEQQPLNDQQADGQPTAIEQFWKNYFCFI